MTNIDTQKLRDIATYSIGSDISGRIIEAADYQRKQQESLMAAADEIDRLRAVIEATLAPANES